ncbi:PR-1-like protein, partial [Nadsonia fulvescens var. elongata DSM 6958]
VTEILTEITTVPVTQTAQSPSTTLTGSDKECDCTVLTLTKTFVNTGVTSYETILSTSTNSVSASETIPPSLSPASDAATFTNADTTYQNEVIARHNLYRRRHYASDLTWNFELANYAKEYLENNNLCFKLTNSTGIYGENLAGGYSTTTGAIDAWYNEVSFFNFETHEPSSDSAHFSQLVWRATTEVGCYTYDCGDVGFRQVVACEYKPRGNINGMYVQNVL